MEVGVKRGFDGKVDKGGLCVEFVGEGDFDMHVIVNTWGSITRMATSMIDDKYGMRRML
jgi:hypothetical protein